MADALNVCVPKFQLKASSIRSSSVAELFQYSSSSMRPHDLGHAVFILLQRDRS